MGHCCSLRSRTTWQEASHQQVSYLILPFPGSFPEASTLPSPGKQFYAIHTNAGPPPEAICLLLVAWFSSTSTLAKQKFAFCSDSCYFCMICREGVGNAGSHHNIQTKHGPSHLHPQPQVYAQQPPPPPPPILFPY